MFSACSDPCVLFPLAASEGVPKNSRLGFATENVAPHQGSAWSNSGKALGIREVVWENCGGSDDSARYYDPSNGRFLSEDPIQFMAGSNFYRYVDNRPLNFIDPFGFCPCDRTGGAPYPSFYARLGEAAGWIGNDVNLWEFRHGGLLDAQADGGSTAYANYAFGVYMAAAGYSQAQTLGFANAYAGFPTLRRKFPFIGKKYPKLKPSDFDPKYTNTPKVNVPNINAGFNDERNGTLCTPTK